MDGSDYTQYRPLMFSIAYRMTGSVSDAEDIMQEAFLRATKDNQANNPKAYLATITTRLAIDHLRSARVRRESYVGTWLPEPLLSNGGADDAPDPAELAETSDSLSMAFLVLLESLSPPERAVFLLREVFGYAYPEIAEVTGKTEAACRQIFARARRRIDEGRPRFETSRAEGEELTSLFLAVARGGLTSMRSFRNFDQEFAVTNELRSRGTDYLLEAANHAGARRFIAQSFIGWNNIREGSQVKTEQDAPAWFGRLLGGEMVVSMMTQVRGASNEKAKRELGWTPAYPSWRDGFPVWAETFKAEHADAA